MQATGVETTLYISEIFKSIQGESTHAGRICTFVRLTGCNIRCDYCDTLYAVDGGVKAGTPMSQDEVIAQVAAFDCRLVELTGGEPLVQKAAVPLMERLLAEGYEVLLETNGVSDLSRVPPAVVKIMDLKTPSSGFPHKNRLDNLRWLNENDEIKFVISDDADYEFARSLIQEHGLDKKFRVLISPEFKRGDRRKIAERVIADGLNVRLNLQLHKFIWPPDLRGV